MLNQHHDERIQHEGNIIFYVAVEASAERIDFDAGRISITGSFDGIQKGQQMVSCTHVLAEYSIAHFRVGHTAFFFHYSRIICFGKMALQMGCKKIFYKHYITF